MLFGQSPVRDKRVQVHRQRADARRNARAHRNIAADLTQPATRVGHEIARFRAERRDGKEEAYRC